MTAPAPLSPVPGGRPPIEAPATAVEPRSPPAWRALLVGALVIPPSALFGIYSYEVVQALHWTMLVIATALGWKDPGAGPAVGSAPFIPEQGAGAFLGVALFVLWSARGHLRETLRAAFRSGHRPPGDLLSPRAVWLGVLVFLILLLYLVTTPSSAA